MNRTTLRNARRGTAAQQSRITAGAVIGAVLLVGALIAPLGTQTYPHKPLRLIKWIGIAAMPDTLDRMRSAGIETLSGTPEQFAGLIKTEIVRWARVVKEANLSIE
jgi:hypothetical protein